MAFDTEAGRFLFDTILVQMSPELREGHAVLITQTVFPFSHLPGSSLKGRCLRLLK